MRQAFVSRFYRQQSGATILEFAIVAPIFFLLMFGILEYGLFMFHKIAIESITMQAGRQATLGKTSGGPCTGTVDRIGYMRCLILDKSSSLINGSETTISIRPVSEGGTSPPDICLFNNGAAVDPPSSNVVDCGDPGDRYVDTNSDGIYEGLEASSDPVAGQVTEVRVNYPWHVLIPWMRYLFGSPDASDPTGQTSGVVMITSSTVVKNEPF